MQFWNLACFDGYSQSEFSYGIIHFLNLLTWKTSISPLQDYFDIANKTWLGWIPGKVCRIMSTYTNSHAKLKKLISDVQFPRNGFELGIIENDFWSSIIWAIQIQVSFPEFENPKNPGIQPNHDVCFLVINENIIATFVKVLANKPLNWLNPDSLRHCVINTFYFEFRKIHFLWPKSPKIEITI